jgi:endonuclease/exonuclease/phosphatase family metal-dependent hydrolase
VTLTLLSYNIRFGGAGRETRIAEVIRARDPDLVVFQEATDPRVVERIAGEAGMRSWAASPGTSTGFAARREVEHHAWLRPPGARHPFLEIVPAGTALRVFGLHLSAVHSRWTEQRRVRELRALLRGIERHQDGFHLLVGDFNALSPGELLDIRRLPPRLRPLVWLSGGVRGLRQLAIQIVLDDGYVDGYRKLHPDDRGYTFPTWDPHVRLDYVFLPERFADRLASCEVVGGEGAVREASDHFPLLARIDAG